MGEATWEYARFSTMFISGVLNIVKLACNVGIAHDMALIRDATATCHIQNRFLQLLTLNSA